VTGVGPTHRLAIDLGTCHTVAVVRRGDEAPRPLLFDGSPLMPSSVYADERGALTVGRDADRLSTHAPARFEPYPKRRVDEGSVLLGDAEVSVVEMLAALLRRVAAEALQSGVNPVGATVLTCPADWGGQRRGVLLAAARAADLGPVELVDEPIAAATYCLRVQGQQVGPGQCLMVFDFGGGTLDVTVVRREPAGLRVLAVGGLDDLGGVDVDAALVGHLGQLISMRAPDVWQRLSAPDSPAAQRDRRTLWSEVKSAKEMLSRASSAPIQVPGAEEALHLTREELDRVAGPLVDRAVDETRRVLQRAGIDARQLVGIFLVGGSSRIPLVASRLHGRFDIAPTVPEQPELPVAYGALMALAAPGAGDGGGPAGAGSAGPVSPVSGGIGRAGYTTGFPVSGSPISPAGSYPGRPFSPTVPSSVSFPPIPAQQAPLQQAPIGPPQGYPPQHGGPGFAVPPVYQPFPLPPPKPARRPWVRYVVLVVVLAVLAGCGYGVWTVTRKGIASIDNATHTTGLNGANGAYGTTGPMTAMKELASVSLPGGGKFAAQAGAGTLYTSSTSGTQTTVAAAGAHKWSQTFASNPTDEKLTVVGNLLIYDGGSDDTQNKDDYRVVLDAASGAIKWKKSWPSRQDILYIGTDALSEDDDGTGGVMRVDLLTGATRWNKPIASLGIYNGFGKHLGQASVEWPGPAGTVPDPRPMDSRGENFHTSLVADPTTVVQLTDGNDNTLVLDASNGHVKASAKLGMKEDLWTVYGGLVIGVTDARDSHVLAYPLTDLKKTAWDFGEESAASVQHLQVCGQFLVCASTDARVDAIDVRNGHVVWSNTFDDSTNQDLATYIVGGKTLYGFATFTQMSSTTVVDPANGKVVRALGPKGTFATASYGYASSGNRVGFIFVKSINSGADSTTNWTVAVGDVTSDKVWAGTVYAAQIEQNVVMSGDVIAFVDEKKRVAHAFTIPAS
jgi:hypothetical protein